ncbi:leucine-rich repeat protein [Tanacetum coccineum]|uniref:Leucine-rich repeat protein n=1 Tax=Tanacetum coccineum TaxID=301880 RepID=A0ABQ5EXQ3_9ASTR
MGLFHLCSSDDVLCMDGERQTLVEFKHGLIDKVHRLASWVVGKESDYFRWTVIVCDNITHHVHRIHLPGLNGHCEDYYNIDKEREKASKQRLRGNLSSSLLHLKQLRHLDLNFLDLLNNAFEVSLHHLSCPYERNSMAVLDLGNNHLSGVIPECWEKLQALSFLKAERYRKETHRASLKFTRESHPIPPNSHATSSTKGSGYHQKDRKPSQNDKTEHGMEKTVQSQMPKSESILKNQQSNRSRN